MRPHRWQPTRLPHPWDSPDRNTGMGYRFLLQCMKVKSESEVAQSRPTLSDPMDCSLPGSSAHRIFQARVLEWGAIAFSDKIVQVTSIPKEKTKPKHNWNLTNSFHIKNSLGLPCEESGWRVCLSMQETRVQSLIQEGPTCHGAAGPLHHNY